MFTAAKANVSKEGEEGEDMVPDIKPINYIREPGYSARKRTKTADSSVDEFEETLYQMRWMRM